MFCLPLSNRTHLTWNPGHMVATKNHKGSKDLNSNPRPKGHTKVIFADIRLHMLIYEDFYKPTQNFFG